PRPPLPTSFPYTTLFRSLVQEGDGSIADPDDGSRSNTNHRDKGKKMFRKINISVALAAILTVTGATVTSALASEIRVSYETSDTDRKSTRLNSSHVKISY